MCKRHKWHFRSLGSIGIIEPTTKFQLQPKLERGETAARTEGPQARNIPSKVVYRHANLHNPQRCFVRLYKKYLALSPADAPTDAYNLQPARSRTSACLFSRNPLGHNPLGGTVARTCRLAGIPGYKTNRSLRATSASRLYQSGVDEQLVMERTGHQSLTGVRSYKRTSDEQREALSDIMNCATKVVRREPAV